MVLPISEDDLLRAVLEMARVLGVKTAHFRPAQAKTGRWITPVQGDGKGWPDLVCCGKGAVLFRELKSEQGRLTPEQVVWLKVLGGAGQDAKVWRPADLRSGRILAELKSVSR